MLVLAAALAIQAPNVITDWERKNGWKLLFDGKSTAGWTNYKSNTIGNGWKVVDGNLQIVNADTAGDIVSTEKFGYFELSLDVKIGRGQNSGIIYHVQDEGDAVWHSGPEVQIYDHPQQEGVETTGFLYQLYGSSVDAAKPAGQWNRLRIHIGKDKCWTEVNGVRYHEYDLNSQEFKDRVAKSKFNVYPNFAKVPYGRIAIQGDHGLVSFRNVKIKSL